MLALVAFVPTVAHAQASRSAEASLHVYADDDDVTVVSPAASARAQVGGAFTVGVGALVDVVTAASVDATTQASPYPFRDVRVEGGGDVIWAATRTVSLTGRAVASTENDYRALRVGAGVRVEAARRNSVVDLAWTAAFDEVGRAGDPRFARARGGHRLALSFTQLLGERTVGDLVLDAEAVTGFQASPYRYVRIVADGGSYALPERVPDERYALAGLVRVRRALRAGVAFHADYRLYRDTWGVTSHTFAALAVASLLGGRLTLGTHGRGYLQDAAVFYRAEYEDDGAGAPAWRTRDRALGGVLTISGGLALDVALGSDPPADAPHLIASLELMRFYWRDFDPQPHRDAVLASVGVAVGF